MYAAWRSRLFHAGSVHLTRQATSPSGAQLLRARSVRRAQKLRDRGESPAECRCGTECLRRTIPRATFRAADALPLWAYPCHAFYRDRGRFFSLGRERPLVRGSDDAERYMRSLPHTEPEPTPV